MDSTTKKETLLVCRRAGEGYPPPEVPSKVNMCDICGEAVWRADSSPSFAKAICMDCFLKLSPEEMQPAEMTEEQRVEIEAYYEAHPEKRPSAIEAFGSVNEEDLHGVPGLCRVIERLCTSLRDLRREAPEKFFGQPVERLYARLEAALSGFYRSQVESTSSEVSSDEPPF